MPSPAAYCPDPSAIPAIPEVTRLSPEKTLEEKKGERDQEKAEAKAEHERWVAGIPLITEEEGRARYQRDYPKADPQQRVFIDVCGAAGQQKGFVVQGAAGAGAGKTKSVVLGVAKAYYDGGVKANQIVVTTFTKKASRELQERLCYYIPKTVVLTLMRVGTYHSGRIVGVALRKARAEFIKKDSLTDLSPILRVLLGEMPKDGSPYVDNIHGVRYRNLGEELGSIGKAAKAYSQLIANKFEPWGVSSPEEVRDYLNSVKDPEELSRGEHERYINLKEAREISRNEDVYPDFPGVWADALLVKEARGDHTLNDLLARYMEVADQDKGIKLFIVDECQDNSYVQMQIALRVARASDATLVMCGDGKQAIFAFRGADASIFQFAPEDHNARRVEIGTNYRSGYWIIEAGNEVCKDEKGGFYPWAVGGPMACGRRNVDGTPVQGIVTTEHYDPKTKTVGQPVAAVEWETYDDAEKRRSGKKGKKNVQIQIAGEIPTAREVATRINAAIQGGRKAGDFAILTATNAALGPFELGLSRFRIPVVYAGSKVNFMSRSPITRMLRLLALCAPGVVEDPEMAARMLKAVLRDDGGVWYGQRLRYMSNVGFFKAVRENWSRGILKTLEALGDTRNTRGAAAWRSAMEDVVGELAPLVRDASWPEAASLAASILRDWEGLQKKKSEDEDEVKVEAEPDGDPEDSFYQSLADIGATFDTYADFMAYVAKARMAQTKGEDEKVEGGSCVLSTAHKSKGLEWPVVYVVACAGLWPHVRSLANPKDLAESRRLYYVALTRARDELHVWSTGEGSSPFTIEVFQNKIFPRMEKARIEAERAKRLAEVEIKELGPDSWGVFRNGVRLALQGVSTFETYDAAAMAYLTPHDEAENPEAPFANQIRAFLDWLQGRAPDLVSRLRANPHHIQLLESLFADGAVSKVLGWSMLADLFPEHPDDIEILTTDNKRLGYLIRGSPTVYQGYLELRAPFTDYVIRPISPDDDPTTYGTRFEDHSPSLLEARYAYATLLPEDRRALGTAVPFDAPTLFDMPLVDFGPTAAQIVAGPVEVDVVVGASAVPLEITLPSVERVREVTDPRHSPRRMLPFKIPEERGWNLLVVSSTGLVLATFYLSRYQEFPLLERAVLKYTSEDGIVSVYRVMAGGVDKSGRVMAETQLIAGGSDDPGFKFSKLDLRPLGQDTLDAGLRAFLDSPGIDGPDQLFWEVTLGRAFRVDLGRFVDVQGTPLISFGVGGLSEAERRLAGSGWFTFERRKHGTEIHWNMAKIQQIYGEGTWLG
jgi:superfamily I DNA/RNA helicase